MMNSSAALVAATPLLSLLVLTRLSPSMREKLGIWRLKLHSVLCSASGSQMETKPQLHTTIAHEPYISHQSESRKPSLDLPFELVDLIISSAWHLPLTQSERIHFITTSMLVNRTWMKTFLEVSCTDLIIPSTDYFNYIFYTVLPGLSEVFDPSFASSLRLSVETLTENCRSVTFYVDREETTESRYEYEYRKGGLTMMLSIPQVYDFGKLEDVVEVLPKVGKLVVRYYDGISSVPEQFDELVFSYTRTYDCQMPKCALERFSLQGPVVRKASRESSKLTKSLSSSLSSITRAIPSEPSQLKLICLS
ncbi:hypothetical protein VKT23_009258 [Stygiomarasmius scandens]|uniref:F-box domain-containing protein n=1 Tax=Marasmiellus scandens TaxID=2682957 RepID=A0ABR1JFI4_9AGAR